MTGPVPNPRRMLLPASAAVFAVVWVWVAVFGPDELAGHMGVDGEVTRWDSKWGLLTGLGLVAVLLVAVFGGVARLMPRVPASAVNLPGRHRKEYWMRPANRVDFDRMVAEDMAAIGAGTLLLMAWILAALAVMGDDRIESWPLIVPVVIYLVAVLGHTVHITVGPRYAIPGD
ncbi:SdpI family protein [Gordonia aurantiaca]|uniref:hypothetical protein n=1 Tax=Gordonia sp. B21 TaxID=3151852 RepID=UPI0032666CA6